VISLIVYCVDKVENKYQYAFLGDLEKRLDTIERNLKAQIDIHQLLGIPNLVILTNFPFSYKGVTAIEMSEAICVKNMWGNKYTLPLKYIEDYNVQDDIWLHDYDCFPQEKFEFPVFADNHIGAIFTGTNYVNGGSLFIQKNSVDFFRTLKKIYDITPYHRSDETLLNDLFFNRQKIMANRPDVCDLFTKFKFSCHEMDRTYNYSFAMAKRTQKLEDFPKTLHFHPESISQFNCFNGKENMIKPEIQSIFNVHFSAALKSENEKLYSKWRHPK